MKEYEVFYADPPWRYDTFSTTNDRAIENHYPTMHLSEVKKLLKTLMLQPAKESILYLWATAPKLQEALEVMKAWGFEYRSCAVWDKMKLGMGYWFRIDHELLLVGKIGRFRSPKAQARVSSVFRKRRTEHSKKPDLIRTLISEWYPDKSKIELFARERFEGWDAWGNEAPQDIQKILTLQENVE